MATIKIIDGFSPSQAALELQVSRTRIDQLIRSGQLDVIATPIGRVIVRKSLERLVRERDAVRDGS